MFKLVLVTFILFSFSPSHSNQCSNLVKAANSSKKFNVVNSHLSKDKSNGTIIFDNGILLLTSSLIDNDLFFFLSHKDDGEQNQSFIPDGLVKQTIDFFGLSNISKLRDIWFYNKYSQSFFKNIKHGDSPRRAAVNSWLGRQAQIYGFELSNLEINDKSILDLSNNTVTKLIFNDPFEVTIRAIYTKKYN